MLRDRPPGIAEGTVEIIKTSVRRAVNEGDVPARVLMEKMESNGVKLVFPHKDNDWVLQTSIERLALRSLIKIKNEQVELIPKSKGLHFLLRKFN